MRGLNDVRLTEVADLGRARTIEQHVLGFEVEVQHWWLARMEVHERASKVQQDGDDALESHWSSFSRLDVVGVDLIVKRAALHELEHQVARLVAGRSLDADAEEHDDVGMSK